MKTSVFACCYAAALTTLASVCWGQVPAPPRENRVSEVEVLTRGPLHEAFAGTVSYDPKPGMVAPKEPPEAIEEIPPEQKPEGSNVAWIPGYFAWDDERTDFVWVSGIWRALPPGRQWLPGYWRPGSRGAQWVSGYWADGEATEVEYLPPPPRSLEEGPSSNPPSDNSVWVPGNWVWYQGRFAWQPGYWTNGHSEWDWIPAHYVWAPRGYVYVNGYYDYPAARRGLLFAPVYANWTSYGRGGYSFSPSVAINTLALVSQLFLRPSYGHYYFGDYYGSNYSTVGYLPWYAYHSSRTGYDPFYARERWNHRGDRDWHRQLQASYDRRRENQNARPPRTWAEQQARIARGGSDRDLLVTTAISELARNTNLPIRLQPVGRDERQNISRRSQEIQQFRRERQRLESVTSTTRPDVRADKSAGPQRMKLPQSPVVARATDQAGKDQPPKRTEVLKPDLTKDPGATPRPGKNRDEPKSVKSDPKSSTEPRPADGSPKTEKGDPKSPRDRAKTSPDDRDSPRTTNQGKGQPRPNTPDDNADRGSPRGKLPQPANAPANEPKSPSKEPRSKGKEKTSKVDPAESDRPDVRTRKTDSQPQDNRRPVPADRPKGKTPRAGQDPTNPRSPNADAVKSDPAKSGSPPKQDAPRERPQPKAKAPAQPPAAPAANTQPPAPKAPQVPKASDKKKEKEKDGGK